MFYIGVDLGQKHDFTAIAVVERESEQFINRARVYNAYATVTPRLLVRRVLRVALGTPYPRVAEIVRELTQESPMAGQCSLVVDATGLGGPVVDMLRALRLNCHLTAVTITGGDHETRRGSNVGVPRRDLIAGVRMAIEKGELKVARRMPGAESLIRELTAMRIDGEGSGEHDDLVMALALACWKAKMPGVWGTSRLPGI
jgi:hypothetical protein